ncbi:NAD-dependent epimerase [Algimonas arctica]|uniref:NAD-dependent epimerase n=1 Tax=Algimonas arctica TaxID=1479486 RepID=A0A8J3CT81_9PROT|nr:NAD-dependent epimerase/dehydratase family protein [Algimonas arctica]GHA99510.1 NAD-dependent epimerase [Algimonas arctica]
MKVLITGTAGFIGQNLAMRLLQAGHEVVGIDSITPYYDVSLKHDRLARLAQFEQFTQHKTCLEDFEVLSKIFAEAHPDFVVHLAAQAGVRYSLENPRAYVETNVIGSFNVTELCREYSVKHLVLASTSSAYGANDRYPFVETDKASFPLTIYAATKQASELIAHSHSHLHNIPTTVLRFFTVYGPWGRPDMAFFLFTKAMFEGRPIKVFNEGKMARDFTYVDDLTRSIELLLDVPPVTGQPVSKTDSLSPVAPYRLVNIGNANPVPLMDFIAEIERAVGVTAQKEMLPMQPGDVSKTFADSDLLQSLTGFRPSTSVRDGVQAFVDWYRDYYAVGR